MDDYDHDDDSVADPNFVLPPEEDFSSEDGISSNGDDQSDSDVSIYIYIVHLVIYVIYLL